MGVHRQYIRPWWIENFTDEYRERSGIDEKRVFTSEDDLDGALEKVRILRRKFHMKNRFDFSV